MPENIDALAKIIWDYHLMNQQLKPAQAILVLGSHDLRVADRAVELFKQGLAPVIIFSGGGGRLTEHFPKPEAELFADRAIAQGVPSEKIIIENKSANSQQNIAFTRRLLQERGLDFSSFIVVQKPYMERRAWATFKKFWPEADITVTSPQLSFDEYINDQYPRDWVVNLIVGDLQRVRLYADKGFQVHQDIPEEVWQAFEKLVALGYDQYLVKE